MRLVSIDVTSYRVIERLHLDLEPGLCLLAGPNESGKSTLVEAIGAALFVRPTGTSEFIQGMRRQGGAGDPEVTVVFDHEDGHRYRVTKRFGRGGGTELKRETGGPVSKTWTGAEAEEQLGLLLGGGGALEGKGVGDHLNRRWGHLCVTQGASVADPLDSKMIESMRREELLAILGRGAHEIALDAMDRAIRDAAAQRFAQSWSKDAQPRLKGLSPASVAWDALVEAKRELSATIARCDSMTEAQETYEQATAALIHLQVQQTELSRRLVELEEQISTARKLDVERRQLEQDLQRLLEETQRLVRLNDTVLGLETDLGAAQKDEAGLAARVAGIQAEVARLDGRIVAELASRGEEEERVRALDARREVLGTHLDLLRLRSEVAELIRQQTSIQEIEAALRSLVADLAELVSVDEATLAELEVCLRAQEEARARLEGMVTRVELVQANCVVELAGAALGLGQPVQLDRPAELVVGPHARLRLVPGGGEGLTEARDSATQTRLTYEQTCSKLGVTGVDQARELKGRRDALVSAAGEHRAALKASRPGLVEKDLADRRQRQTTLQARLDLLVARAPEPDSVLPDTIDAVQGELSSLESALITTRGTFVRCDETLRGSQTARQAVAVQLARTQAAHQARTSDMLVLESQLSLASSGLADRASREAEISSAKRKVEDEQEKLKSIVNQLEPLKLPKLLDDQERLRAQKQANAIRREELLRAQISSESRLTADGQTDLRESRLLAQAEVERLAARHRRAEREALADRLLHEVLRETEQELQRQVAGPFQERISELLDDLFLERSHVSVSVGGNMAIEQVARESRGEFPFDKLSTGTRQQVAAAVRLALAGILATEHGDSLPVILDDAFGACDPQRLDGVQRMLVHAVKRGLQVIMLGCDPRDWAALGDCQRISLPSDPVARHGGTALAEPGASVQGSDRTIAHQ